MPTKTSGRAVKNMRRMRASNLAKRGRSRSTSNSPITARDSAGSQALHPAACILGPATPKNSVSGARRLNARIRSAPKVSPEASPATRPTRRGADIRSPGLANDAARTALDEGDEGLDFRLSDGRLLEFRNRGLQLEPRTIQQPIGATDIQYLCGGESPPLQADRV